MIILDTNIISEFLRKSPAPSVMQWLAELPEEELATTVVTIAELRFGAQALPAGKRADQLNRQISQMLEEHLLEVLPFDLNSAEICGVLAARLRANGIAIGMSDTMIASIALCHDAPIATRNIRHFKPCKVQLINPFEL